MSTTKEHKKTINRLYVRYEYLAEVYAKKIYNYEHLGMEREDVIQEHKMKIWYSIQRFIKRWKLYKETDKFKPIPLPYFIKNNLNKLNIDLTKKINSYYVDSKGQKQQRINGMISMQEVGFDMGIHNEFMSDMNLEGSGAIVIRGINLCQGLDNRESRAFKMYLKGHKLGLIQKVLPDVNVSNVVRRQNAFLQRFKTDLLGEDRTIYKTYSMSEED